MGDEELLQPACWLLMGLPWPETAAGGMAECAFALAPPIVPRRVVSRGASAALNLAEALARDPQGPGRLVFFSDVTLFLDRQGKTWPDLGIDYEAVIDELTRGEMPGMFLTLSQWAHAVVCDATRNGMQLYYPDGRTDQITPQDRRAAHEQLAAALDRDWPPFMQGVIDRNPPMAP